MSLSTGGHPSSGPEDVAEERAPTWPAASLGLCRNPQSDTMEITQQPNHGSIRYTPGENATKVSRIIQLLYADGNPATICY